MARFREVCEEAARAGGQVLRDLAGRIHPREKAPKDLVTEADFAAQATIQRIVQGAFPDHAFIGEEGEASPGAAECPFCWVVDPLDGTLNYTRQLPNYSVSVALRQHRHIVCGVVYDPVLDECFAAVRGEGATLNGARLRSSQCEHVEQALIAASLPADITRGSVEVERFIEVMYQSQSIRRLGSAALNLCYVASGRLDGYWATCVKSWDVAAGQLIAAEAGATITRPDGSPFDLDRPQFVAAATPRLHQELTQLLRRVGQRQ